MQELKKRLDRGDNLVVLDVRRKDEWNNGHIKGALHIYVCHLEERLKEVPVGQPIARANFIACMHEGDHVILVGEVLHAEAEEGLDDINPILHDSGEKFRSIGKEIILKRRR